MQLSWSKLSHESLPGETESSIIILGVHYMVVPGAVDAVVSANMVITHKWIEPIEHMCDVLF